MPFDRILSMGIFDNKKNKKYRYKVLTEMVRNDKELQEFLNDQADLGWRPVNFTVEKITDLEDVPCRFYRIIFESYL